MSKIFEIKASSADEVELFLYGEIGWDVDARSVINNLNAHAGAKKIVVRINSVGGNVFEAQAIYSYLKSLPARVEVFIDGLAASAASVVAMAGDLIKMPRNALMMVHNAHACGIDGEAGDLRKEAALLDKIREILISVYAAKSGKGADEIGKMLDAETWLTADEAKAAGLIDEIIGEMDLSACMNNLILNRGRVSVENKLEIKSAADLAKNYPEFAKNLISAAVVEALKNERERLKALDDLSAPGCEEIINRAKYESFAEARDVVMDLWKAEHANAAARASELAKLQADAAGLENILAPSKPEPDLKNSRLEVEQAAVAKIIDSLNAKGGF